MSETRSSTPDSLEVVPVPPATITGNIVLFHKRFLVFVREDMRQLSERTRDTEKAKSIILQALQDTLKSLQEENTEPEPIGVEDDQGAYVGEAAFWTPEDKKMAAPGRVGDADRKGGPTDGLGRMGVCFDVQGHCWMVEGRQEGSDREANHPAASGTSSES